MYVCECVFQNLDSCQMVFHVISHMKRSLVCVKLVNNSFLVIWYCLTSLKPNDRWLFADGGVGNPDAVYREQEHNPAGPRLPDPPAGVVRLRLPALVSHRHTFTCPNFLLHALKRNVLVSESVQTFFFFFSAVKWRSSYVLDNLLFFFIFRRPHTLLKLQTHNEMSFLGPRIDFFFFWKSLDLPSASLVMHVSMELSGRASQKTAVIQWA